MKKLLLCGLIILGGCALKTVDEPATEPAPSTEIQASVQKSVQKTKAPQKVSKSSKVVKKAKKKPAKKSAPAPKVIETPKKQTAVKTEPAKKSVPAPKVIETPKKQTAVKTEPATKSAPAPKQATTVTPAKEPLKCADIIGVRLYQIFKTFAMGKTCSMQEKNFFCAAGKTVYVEAEKGKSYQYDDVILPKAGECFAYDGTFHYHSRGGKPQSAPRVKLITKPKQ